MQEKFWASLHNHSDYSNASNGFRDSTNKLSDLINYAVKLQHKAVAITDHEITSSWIKAQEYEEEINKINKDFKVILGNEIYLTRNGLNGDNFRSGIDKYYHFILLARTIRGARKIQELSTRAWMRSYSYKGLCRRPTYYADLREIIGDNSNGDVIASTACLGSYLGTQLLEYKRTNDIEVLNNVKKWARKIKEIFGEENFFLEMQPNLSEDQVYVNNKIVELSSELNIPYIITCDAHYLKKEDRPVHKAFLNSQGGDREVDDFYATTYLMSTEEVKEESGLSDIVLHSAYSNIEKIIDRCERYSLKKPLKIPELIWKEHSHNIEEYDKYVAVMPNLELFYSSERRADNELVWALIEGIKKHEDLQNEQAYYEINDNLRITWESSNVNNASWSAYFLNLQKIIETIWEAGSLVGIARGSCAGFLLLYALGIIQVNCLREKTKTFSWRFLNPERVSVLD